MKNLAFIKLDLIEKAYKKHPNLVRFPRWEEFTYEWGGECGILIFWYNVPLPNGTQTTKIEVYKHEI